MREGRPSFTAAAVAFARGVAGVDALARDLVPQPFAAALAAGGRLARPLTVASLGLVDHIELRTRAIDRALEEAVLAGARQIVILGAGLDARAHRMRAVEDTAVFEVDHPATQAYKRARMEARPPRARRLTYVAVDFAKDSLAERLASAGHDPGVRTFWIWEGVTMYLPPAAVRATLEVVAARSPAESRLAVTYATPEGTSLGPAAARVALVGFHVLGEAILGLTTAEQMRGELSREGFDVLSDTSPRDWARAFDHPPRRRVLLIRERLAVARRRG